MKTSIFNPSSFLPTDVLAWAEEKGCAFISEGEQVDKHLFDQCFIGFNDCSKVQHLAGSSAEVDSLRIFDGIRRYEDKLWPHIFIKNDLQASIAKRSWGLQRQKPCFLLGCDLTNRWMLSFVLQMGFKEVIIFSSEPEWAPSFERPGTNFHWLAEKDIPTMGFVGGFFLAHLESGKADAELIEAIKYMHFLEKDSYIIDLSKDPAVSADFLPEEHRMQGVSAWTEILQHRL